MEFHISRTIREKLNVDGLLFGYTGNVVFADVSASRKLAVKLTQLRAAEAEAAGTVFDAAKGTVNAGAMFAMGLIDELNHALVARYREEIDPAVLQEALRWFEKKIGPDNVERLLLEFVQAFPSVEVYKGAVTASKWLAGTTEGLSNREAALEELMLLWLTNINPAFQSFRELFDDSGLQGRTPYGSVTKELPDYFETRPRLSAEAGSLFDALSAPMKASPDSLTGQLDFIRENWPKLLGGELPRILLAIDVLKEEELAVWMRFHPPGPDRHRHGAPGFSGEGFVGDEFVGYDEFFGGEYEVGPDGVKRRKYDKDYQAPLNEYEAFSADQAWMPNVVLMAKSTYVWLEQLSKKYQRHIYHLNHIPDEELRLLQERGITGLWLIGLWERSIASRTIKRLRGQGDAVASAYSLKEYNIAEDLGGAAAYADLRDRAQKFGLRLASDMVPNHMGIDSPWVIEHPDWFISKPESPFPVYQFEGPDISPDSRVEIKIEDHYYDQTDAAVAFRLRNYASGETRYIYHGNDGTSFAWNDTAQLDYSKAYVREHVIQVILHVARQFPIIRFDAAMVLAKRHVQRLWFPLPGAGGSIPSRAENAISEEQFDALMPHEFWREVVDRVAVEVPGTLLLAEAFWLLEGYFVRTLGMHRVYNSAFMNMLRDEENAKYRSYLKKTIEFDPDIMKRYVNFMSNPDERTAIDQFGSGDKFFGVATMLSTLPGLPMFAHGQIEGYGERYGMEFKQAKFDEWPNEGLVARHNQVIAPLLKQRYIFAESANFVLYDFWNDFGGVDENVFAYSNRYNDQRSLIFYNNRYEGTKGSIHVSAASMDKGSGELRQTSLTAGMALPGDYEVTLAYRDLVSGLEYLKRASDLNQHGFFVELRGYQYVVLLNWRELRSTAEQPWDRLCDSLSGRGVHSVDEALLKLRFGSLHDALRQAVSAANVHLFADVAGKQTPVKDGVAAELDEQLREFEDKSVWFFERTRDSLPEVFTGLIETGVTDTLLPGRDTFDLDRHGKDDALANGDDSDLTTTDVSESVDLREDYRKTCRDLAIAAVGLPGLAASLAAAVPIALPEAEAMRLPLPGAESGTALDLRWAQVLAWIALRSLPVARASARAQFFDMVQLRSALAENLSSMGVEGERTWRAAAQVRLLLAYSDREVSPIGLKEFWQDADVRWLAGVNESSGKTYVNKELFEELAGLLELPVLLEIAAASDPEVKAKGLEKVAARVVDANKAIRDAGYDVDRLIEKLAGKSSGDVKKSVEAGKVVDGLEEVADDKVEAASEVVGKG